MGFDAIGFHAIAELITGSPPPVTYNSLSKPSGAFTSTYFQKGATVTTVPPTVVTT